MARSFPDQQLPTADEGQGGDPSLPQQQQHQIRPPTGSWSSGARDRWGGRELPPSGSSLFGDFFRSMMNRMRNFEREFNELYPPYQQNMMMMSGDGGDVDMMMNPPRPPSTSSSFPYGGDVGHGGGDFGRGRYWHPSAGRFWYPSASNWSLWDREMFNDEPFFHGRRPSFPRGSMADAWHRFLDDPFFSSGLQGQTALMMGGGDDGGDASSMMWRERGEDSSSMSSSSSLSEGGRGGAGGNAFSSSSSSSSSLQQPRGAAGGGVPSSSSSSSSALAAINNNNFNNNNNNQMEQYKSRLGNYLFGNHHPLLSQNFACTPRVDVRDSGDALTVHADLPGMRKEDVSVSVKDGKLVITGERSDKTEERGENSFRQERCQSRFFRSLHLPPGANEKDVSASFDHGVLDVKVPYDKAVDDDAGRYTVPIR